MSIIIGAYPVSSTLRFDPPARLCAKPQVSVPGLDIAYFVDGGSGSVTVPVK